MEDEIAVSDDDRLTPVASPGEAASEAWKGNAQDRSYGDLRNALKSPFPGKLSALSRSVWARA